MMLRSNGVATATEEMTATVQEIASNISQASQEIEEVNQNVNRTSSVSVKLQQIVGRFKV